MTRVQRRGASLATYGIAVGLVAVGVAVAVSQTGGQVTGLTSRVAATVNAVDGALSGNKPPVYEGLALADQSVAEHDPLQPINARGFHDPEGDDLTFSLALTGELVPEDFTPAPFPDGLVIDGSPSGTGTLAVVATDPIGRKAVAGPIQIAVAANRLPVIAGVPAPETVTEGEILSVVYSGVEDLDGDSLTYSLSYGADQTFELSGTTLTATFTADVPGDHKPVLTVTDGHGLATQAAAFDLQVWPETCLSLQQADPAAASGITRIDPDGPGGRTPVDTYCDMATDGGGWTMVGWAPDTFPQKEWLRVRYGTASGRSGAEWSLNSRHIAFDEVRMGLDTDTTRFYGFATPAGVVQNRVFEAFASGGETCIQHEAFYTTDGGVTRYGFTTGMYRETMITNRRDDVVGGIDLATRTCDGGNSGSMLAVYRRSDSHGCLSGICHSIKNDWYLDFTDYHQDGPTPSYPDNRLSELTLSDFTQARGAVWLMVR